MKKKKILALLLLSAMGLSLLGGCGNKKVTPKDIQDTEVTEDDLESDLAEEGDIVIGQDSTDSSSDEDAEDADEDDEDDEDEEDEEDEEVADPNLHTESTVFDEKNNVTFNYSAQKGDVKDLPASAEMKESAGDLDAARWEALKIFYEGDEADAKEEMEELQNSDPLSADLLKKIEPYYPKLAPYLAQSQITHYDMTKPYYVDEEEIDFDMYTDNYTTFYLTIYLNEDGSISEFELEEEESYDETDDEDDEDEDDFEIVDDDEDVEDDEE